MDRQLDSGTRRKFAALRTKLKALPPVDTTGLVALAPEEPALLRLAQHLDRHPKTTLATIENASTLFKTIAADAPGAARGDPKAQLRLSASLIQGSRTIVALENVQTQQAIDSMQPDQPGAWLGRSSIAVNEGMMEVLNVLAAEVMGETVDADAASVRIARLADEARSAARRIDPAVRRMIERNRSDEAMKGSSLLTRMEGAFATFDESVKVELQMADHLERLAEFVAESNVASDEVDKHLDAISDLADERMRIDAERRALIAQ